MLAAREWLYMESHRRYRQQPLAAGERIIPTSYGRNGGDSTFNTDALSFVGESTNVIDTVDDVRVEIWSMVNPDVGTHDIVVDLTDTANTELLCGAASFSNVIPELRSMRRSQRAEYYRHGGISDSAVRTRRHRTRRSCRGTTTT